MKRKALIIGALPRAFRGPWVKIDDADSWVVVRDGDYGNGVLVEVKPHGAVMNGRRVIGTHARAVILGPIPDVRSVSIWLEEAQ